MQTRLDATQFNTTKSQKKIIHKFNRYVKGTWDPDPTVKLVEQPSQSTSIKKTSANNYVEIKSLRDSLHEPEIEQENKYKLKVKKKKKKITFSLAIPFFFA
jgi:arginine-tRNA-protein transferase